MWAVTNAEVTRVFYDGKGAALKESFTKRDGSTGEAYYSAFFDQPHGLSVGESAKFSGALSTKAREYQDKNDQTRTAVDVVLNSARAEDVVSGGVTDGPF